MNIHPIIPYDQALVEEVAARTDLRVPNKEALDAVARHFDKAHGEPFELVCALATAVGKTYLAAGLIEYLAEAGVRHVLIVVPGSTILNKTVANFSEGHSKSLTAAMSRDPLVITAENFRSGRIASALEDEDQVKLYVFTVQSLLRPQAKVSRRVRRHQEWVGTGLYQRLKEADDLVVIADEHHVYNEQATAFARAVRDLDPMALVGLTATPAKSDAHKVIYSYPLARAIADQYVKTPVLVGRKDKLTGVEVQLRDGLRLLDAKQKAANAYAEATAAHRINAVMFVVADTIDNANAISETLRQPNLLGGDYDQQVLVIHSDARDDALARLEAVEDPDSPVRVIVSVSMLKEGWDVKNIYVICSFRPSISEALTEQTLGRGLRLPWNAYTGVELLDTLEVLSHERYQELLEKAGVLLEGLTEQRAVDSTDSEEGEETGQTVSSPQIERVGEGEGDDTAAAFVTDGGAAEAREGGPAAPLASRTGGDHSGAAGFLVSGTDTRCDIAEQQAETLTRSIPATRKIKVPKLHRIVTSRDFSLSDIDDDTFRQLGQRLASEGGTELDRKLLEVIEDPTQPSGLRLVPTTSREKIAATEPSLSFPEARQRLMDTVLSLDEVSETRTNRNAAERLADAVVDGASTERALAAQFNAVLDMIRITIRNHYRHASTVTEDRWTSERFAPTRTNHRPEEPNRFGKFSRSVAYTGWAKSTHALNWFDSEPERHLANLLDDDDQVELWARIQSRELVIPWQGGRYHPDFYALAGGVNYLIEVKADKDIANPDVRAKRDAAEKWARQATDEGEHGTWHYLLVSQSAVEHASTFDGIVQQAE